MLEVAIVDDESPARSRLRRLLAAHPDVRVTGDADSVSSALALIRATAPAVLFLDIQLGIDDAFSLLRRLTEPYPLVIFATAFHQHAVRAFDVAAVDYLLKPFDADRLSAALARCRARLSLPDLNPPGEDIRRLRMAIGSQPPLQHVAVLHRGQRQLVPMASVLRIHACGNYVELVTQKQLFLLRMPLGSLAQRLDPLVFLRIHRSHLVRADQVKRVCNRAHGDANVYLHDGTVLLVSRRYRAALPFSLRK